MAPLVVLDFDVVSGLGSPAAIIAASFATILLMLKIFPGMSGIVKDQHDVIISLEDRNSKLKQERADDHTAYATELASHKAKIVELEAIIASTRDLSPFAELIHGNAKLITEHELRATERHRETEVARKKENEAVLGVLQQIANQMPPDPNGHSH